jgi:hypothetical protein
MGIRTGFRWGVEEILPNFKKIKDISARNLPVVEKKTRI